MTIEIINVESSEIEGRTTRTVEIAIDNGGPIYRWFVGGLPETGDLQPILDTNESYYLARAIAKNSLLPQDSQDQLGAKGWIANNSAAKLLFTLSVSELEIEVSDLVDVSFPSITAGQRTKWKLLLMMLALSVRVFARRLGLLD